MWTVSFWKQAAERAIKTFAGTLGGLLLVAGPTGLLDVGWKQALSTSALTTLISLLMSLGSSGIGPKNGPSLVSTEPATE